LPALALLLGLFALGVIGFASRPARTATTSRARRSAGWLLVLVPLPSALALHLFLRPEPALDRLAFVVGTVAFAFGALLVLPSKDEDEHDEGDADPDPTPWWPEFERDFRAYARRSPAHPRSVRGSRE
jgi:hypothetical protein